MSIPPGCDAQYVGGCNEVRCARCGVRWDADDTPPPCKPHNAYVLLESHPQHPNVTTIHPGRMSYRVAETRRNLFNRMAGWARYRLHPVDVTAEQP